MATVDFANIGDGFRQEVDKQIRLYFENNAPGYNSFRKNVDTKPTTQKGYRIPLWTERPGGHTGFVPSASSFNATKAPQSNSMWVFPVPYAIPMVFEGSVLRAYKVDPANAIGSLAGTLELYTQAATRRINMAFYGDGQGAWAYAAGTLGGTGAGQTLTCTTAAAATMGQTKGARWLEANQVYQAYIAATGAVRGTFTVTTVGSSTCVVNVTSGSITSGDPICDPGGFNRYMRGMGWLVSAVNRDLQGLDTTVFSNFNAPETDLNGATATPGTIETVKTTLNTRNNSEDASGMLTGYLSFAQHSVLRRQGYSFGYYLRNGSDGDTVKGVAKRFEDGDTVFIRDAYMDEDRGYFIKNDAFAMFEEMPLGQQNIDGLTWRNLLGSNSSGSDDWQQAIMQVANPGVLQPQSSAFFKRAAITGLPTQVSAGMV